MGWYGMGKHRGNDMSGSERNNPLRGDYGHAGPSDTHPGRLGLRVPGGKRKHRIPEKGERFGKLRVERYEMGPRGGIKGIYVSCQCTNHEHIFQTDVHNLLAGKSTKCRFCADVERGKSYEIYADIVPDRKNRQRLLNRISAAIVRCHNPRSKNYQAYGGRGITVWEPWRTDRREWLKYLISLPNWDIHYYEIDRIDNDRGYEPGNLQFIPPKSNCQNKRTVRNMQQRIDELEAEIYRLRSAQLRAEKPIHHTD
jgi:hypothetical protein